MESKVYETRSQKVLDFLAGFFLAGAAFDYAVVFVLVKTDYSRPGLVLSAAAIAAIGLCVFLYRWRKHIGSGFIAVLACHAAAVVPYFLMRNGD